MKKSNESISLPCLRGSIGDWNYYNVVMPFSEMKRLDNDHIIKESKSLDDYLQRKLSDRKNKIKEYLLFENQRYFNSIIVGVYGAMPEWIALDLSPIAKQFDVNIGSQVNESLGVLTLTGEEILFTIDGQHRVEGIKLALNENSTRFINDELSVVFVAHKNNQEGKIRTRKLFATINREAVKPSKNDLAIIDEKYAYNIIARDLFSKYSKFKDKIALTETTNLDRDNHTDFTNLLTLVEVNKKVLRLANVKQKKYTGPSVEERKILYDTAENYWNHVISKINEYNTYFRKPLSIKKFRNSENTKPLNLLFVPIGQKFIAELYYYCKKSDDLGKFDLKINKLNFDLHKGHFKGIFYNPVKNTMIMNNQTFAKRFALYLMGYISNKGLKAEYAKALGINTLSEDYENLSLPDQF